MQLALVLCVAIGIAPEECQREFLIAVNGNAMSWFCCRWDLSDRDFEAKSSMELYRTVAGDVLAGRVFDIRAFTDSPTVLIKGDSAKLEKFMTKRWPKIPFAQMLRYVGNRGAYKEYEWKISSSSQGLVKSLIDEFKDVKPGPRR
jgi:hypothetical protein